MVKNVKHLEITTKIVSAVLNAQDFEIKHLSEYHHMYDQNNILLLADVFE